MARSLRSLASVMFTRFVVAWCLLGLFFCCSKRRLTIHHLVFHFLAWVLCLCERVCDDVTIMLTEDSLRS
ncbi:hypothetical protein HanXRQr2_Chr02g0085871 [Helianthus annuus]|uniref:Uncharacterized protein n=1 Tax=Helianthus annuus TaxID=4232 RepID=A0A9K3P2R5_HELAN|nr:hypothetical protein HanXRQr2_Chr02g0085871 [Helianthus annuus]KAJ0620250.1 hypothetical protein HanHA89_Chr02g0080211 [Helianthus annuus]KAJ0787659.1 hypothetical protein HanOQP8_Chr02g0084831 [Helianthus annuus]